MINKYYKMTILFCKEDIIQYTKRDVVLDYSDEEMSLLMDKLKEALFWNDIWDILKDVIDLYENDKKRERSIQ